MSVVSTYVLDEMSMECMALLVIVDSLGGTLKRHTGWADSDSIGRGQEAVPSWAIMVAVQNEHDHLSHILKSSLGLCLYQHCPPKVLSIASVLLPVSPQLLLRLLSLYSIQPIIRRSSTH